MLLPGEIDISERSRKFYDGTYKLSSDGFIDEAGEYRAFDCMDPDARAPTPLPPMLLEDDVEGVSLEPLMSDSGKLEHRMGSNQRSPSTLPATPGGKTIPPGRRADSPTEFMFASDFVDGTPIKISQTELLCGYENRERLLGKIEGIQLASRQKGTELSQAGCYQLCGIVYSEAARGTSASRSKHEVTPPSKLSKGKTDNSSSPLSDYPSDLSDPESSKKKAKTPASKAIKNAVQQTSKIESPSKRPTRGVAQKVVRKTPTKAAAAPAVITLQQEGRGTRRRSTRNSLDA